MKINKEALIGVGSFVLVSAVLISADAFELIYEFTRAHEAWELDELISALLAALLSMLLASIIATARKNSELRDAVAAARTAQVNERLASKAKTRFINSMNHELRTPLNAVLGFSELLLERRVSALTETQRNYVEEIRKAGSRLLAVVEDVLTMADIDTLTAKVEVAEVDIATIVRRCVDASPTKGGASGIGVQLDAPATCTAMADRAFVHLIVTKLIANAVAYSPPDGAVVVSVSTTPEGRVEVAVTDSGPGIPPDRLASIFDAFDRGGRESLAIAGTGVGLTIGRHLAHAMDGALSVSSQEGVGTTFTLSLDRAGSPDEKEPTGFVAEPQSKSRSDGTT